MAGGRARAFAAIIRDSHILMVHIVDGNKHFWTLPGGGLEEGETYEQAVVREVQEEVNLQVKVVKFLFANTYSAGSESCYLVEIVGNDAVPALGRDSELPEDKQVLQEVMWRPMEEVKDDLHVSQVIRALSLQNHDADLKRRR